jgi:hypothetical protein
VQEKITVAGYILINAAYETEVSGNNILKPVK